MTVAERSIYAKITNHVQMVGYREVVEAQGKARGLTGLVFNDVDGSVKVMARGPEPVLTEFIQDLKSDRSDTVIDSIEIIEDIALPSPFGRIAVDDVKEYMARFDKGIGILEEINIRLGNHTGILNEHTTVLKEMNEKLDDHTGILNEHTTVLKGINEKLDDHTGKLDGINTRLDNHTGILNEHTTVLKGMNEKLGVLNTISDKLDALPERIAKAMNK